MDDSQPRVALMPPWRLNMGLPTLTDLLPSASHAEVSCRRRRDTASRDSPLIPW
jgi:hypothetical protein